MREIERLKSEAWTGGQLAHGQETRRTQAEMGAKSATSEREITGKWNEPFAPNYTLL